MQNQNVPTSSEKATELPDAELWRSAAEKEIGGLRHLKVYEVDSRSAGPPGKIVVGPNWIRSELKPDKICNTILVAQGQNQAPGRDCLVDVRMLPATPAETEFEVVEVHVESAFLYADMEEEVFVAKSPGIETKENDGDSLDTKLGEHSFGLAQSFGKLLQTIDPIIFAIWDVLLKSETCIYI